ncbi:MAG: cobalamin-dependent protein [Candidatus Methanomethylophilus sp.]|nr:cobalamin-dependent protein [Methanomethylophilus sp.]MBQ5448372.1 cobalamin-dependent protein [Methanomethylophilus sp.]
MIDYSKVDFSKILTRYDVKKQVVETPEQVAAKMMPKDPLMKAVAEAVLYKKLKDIMPAMQAAMAKNKPDAVINEGLVPGIEAVGTLYNDHVYYLPDMMVAAKVMEIGIKMAEKEMGGARETKATVIMHAAEGDPHDIGKNIAAAMMKAAGYNVIDMGRDVPVATVIAKVEEVKPLFFSGTALMTTTMSAFPAEAALLKEKNLNIPLMGCGGAVNREYATSYDLGIYSAKANQTALIAQKIIDGYDWKKINEEWDNIVGGA